MIKEEELRIYNWLLFDGIPAQVAAIDLDMDDENVPLVTFINPYNVVELNYGRVEPIPLSPEILEISGFENGSENNGNLVVYRRSKYTIAWWGTRWQMWINTTDLTFSPQYVHQLQNTYFTLTGKELEIKIPQTA